MTIGLENYRRSVTSQNGEDGIIERIFQIMPPANRWCVETGAMDGLRLSNTYNLITSHQWSSVQIEMDRRRFKYLSERHRQNPSVHCIHSRVWFDGDEALDRLLSTTPAPVDFDLLSLDIDGYDYHVWNAMEKYHPRLVVIEFNDTIPDYVSYVQKLGAGNQGSSLKAMTDLGRRKGYELVCVNSINAFYVWRECFPLFGIEDNSISNLWQERIHQTQIFELYDHTLMLSGYGKYEWSRRFGRLKIINGRTNEPIHRYTNEE